MTFTLTIDCDNAAFGDTPAEEIARILRVAAEKVESGAFVSSSPIRDINGNTVGEMRLTE